MERPASCICFTVHCASFSFYSLHLRSLSESGHADAGRESVQAGKNSVDVRGLVVWSDCGRKFPTVVLGVKSSVLGDSRWCRTCFHLTRTLKKGRDWSCCMSSQSRPESMSQAINQSTTRFGTRTSRFTPGRLDLRVQSECGTRYIAQGAKPGAIELNTKA